VPIFWTEERVSKSGDRLPYTELHVAGLTLCFHGRFGSKLKEAAQHLEARQLSALRMGETVRLVQMDGCMAHIRGRLVEGVVVGFAMKQFYGSAQRVPCVSIKLSDGSIDERCAEPRLWFRHVDGIMEYRF
jgi:hypothetical protein